MHFHLANPVAPPGHGWTAYVPAIVQFQFNPRALTCGQNTRRPMLGVAIVEKVLSNSSKISVPGLLSFGGGCTAGVGSESSSLAGHSIVPSVTAGSSSLAALSFFWLWSGSTTFGSSLASGMFSLELCGGSLSDEESGCLVVVLEATSPSFTSGGSVICGLKVGGVMTVGFFLSFCCVWTGLLGIGGWVDRQTVGCDVMSHGGDGRFVVLVVEAGTHW